MMARQLAAIGFLLMATFVVSACGEGGELTQPRDHVKGKADPSAKAGADGSPADSLSAQPAIRPVIHLVRRTGRGWVMRFGIENTSEHPAQQLDDEEYSVTFSLENGGIFEMHAGNANAGARDFVRSEYLLDSKPNKRNPNTLRLTFHSIDGHAKRLTSDVEVAGRQPSTFNILLSTPTVGGESEIAEYRWENGILESDGAHDETDETEETDEKAETE